MKISPALTKRPLGRILLDGEFIIQAELDAALVEQRRTNELLGDILVRLGVIDPVELEVALSVQRDLATAEDAVRTAAGVRRMLGDLLVQARRITQGQLAAALEEQKKTGEKFGEVLVRLGQLSQGELDAALAFQKNQEGERPVSSRLTLGELLVSAGYITRQELEDALRRQRQSSKKLGEVLIEAGYAKPHEVAHGLRLQSMLLTAALTAALSLSSFSTAHAQPVAARPASAKVTVSATVLARASIKVLHQAPEIVVTDADIRRGFVDISAGSLIELKNNSLSGCLLTFEAHGLPFKEALVRGLGREVSIGPNGGMIFQTFKGTVTMALSYRFVLSEDAQPGTYTWPLSLSASPL